MAIFAPFCPNKLKIPKICINKCIFRWFSRKKIRDIRVEKTEKSTNFFKFPVYVRFNLKSNSILYVDQAPTKNFMLFYSCCCIIR